MVLIFPTNNFSKVLFPTPFSPTIKNLSFLLIKNDKLWINSLEFGYPKEMLFTLSGILEPSLSGCKP